MVMSLAERRGKGEEEVTHSGHDQFPSGPVELKLPEGQRQEMPVGDGAEFAMLLMFQGENNGPPEGQRTRGASFCSIGD